MNTFYNLFDAEQMVEWNKDEMERGKIKRHSERL